MTSPEKMSPAWYESLASGVWIEFPSARNATEMGGHSDSAAGPDAIVICPHCRGQVRVKSVELVNEPEAHAIREEIPNQDELELICSCGWRKRISTHNVPAERLQANIAKCAAEHRGSQEAEE